MKMTNKTKAFINDNVESWREREREREGERERRREREEKLGGR